MNAAGLFQINYPQYADLPRPRSANSAISNLHRPSRRNWFNPVSQIHSKFPLNITKSKLLYYTLRKCVLIKTEINLLLLSEVGKINTFA